MDEEPISTWWEETTQWEERRSWRMEDASDLKEEKDRNATIELVSEVMTK